MHELHESFGKVLWHIRVICAIRVQILRTLVVVLNTNLANSTIFWGKEQRCICGIYYLSFLCLRFIRFYVRVQFRRKLQSLLAALIYSLLHVDNYKVESDVNHLRQKPLLFQQ